MKKISKYFIQGLIALLPIVLTSYIIYWLVKTAEILLGSVIKFIIPDKLYLPGMGVAAGLLMVLGFGLLLNLWLFRRLFEAGERQLEKVPFIKYFYNSFKDLAGFFDAAKKKNFRLRLWSIKLKRFIKSYYEKL